MSDPISIFRLLPPANAGLTPVLNFIGAFHPATTHLPIGLLMAAGAIEAFNLVRYRGASRPNQAAVVCLCLGAIGSILTAAAGWGLRMGMKDTALIELHRWMGVGLVIFSLVTAVIAVAAYRKPQKPIVRTYQGAALLSAGLVGLVGMYGGEVSFGQDHYQVAWQTMMEKYHGVTPVSSPVPAPSPVAISSQPSMALEYTRDIKPIFEANCVKCHGTEKQKGDYRLDTKAHAFTAGETQDEHPVVPGSAEKSLLVKVIVGQGDYEDKKMPPKGKALADDQIATIRRWIDQGAQ